MRQTAKVSREEPSISPKTGDDPREQAAEYTYLTIPKAAESRPCIGVVLAGLTARAGVGVGGLEEAISVLEDAHEEGHRSYRFSLRSGEIIAQVEGGLPEEALETTETDEKPGWRTLVELAS